jgi:MFS family permease
MVLLVGFCQLFGFFFSVLMPAYAADALQVGETGLGGLNAAVGVGALAGSLMVASAAHSRRQGLLLTMGSFLFPLAILLFSISRSLAFSMLCLGLGGIGFVAQSATINTLIQSTVPDELRGRVMAVYALMFFGTTPFAALMAGSLGQAFGVRVAIASGAGITLCYTLFVFLTKPSLRHAHV